MRIKDKDGEIYTWVMANNEETGQLTIRPFWTNKTDQEIIDTMQKILRKGGKDTFSLKEKNHTPLQILIYSKLIPQDTIKQRPCFKQKLEE